MAGRLALPQIGDIDRGRSRHRPRNDPSLFGGPWPFIQTGDVRAANRFLTSFTETYSEFGLSQSRLWPKGTVCITIAANIAETAILAIDACFPDSVVGFTADIERTTPSYVEFFLRTARDELTAFAPATAQKNINLETLSRIQLPMAPLDEQREIVDRIEKAFSWIDRLATETTNARKLIDHLDQAVMAKAFRGELVPQDPNDEPASVLLERIQAEKQSKQPRRREHIARSRA
jgi:type I restriction enzyme, S subunit